MILLLTLLLSQFAFGAVCTKTGSSPGAVFTCADTGNADTNRANFQDTLNSATYDCGDTIILPVANHDTAVSGTSGTGIISTPISLPAKNTTLCIAGGKYLNIIGARNAELPPRGTRVTTADEAKMPVIRSSGNYQAMTIASGARHYRIRGLLFMPKSTVDSGCTTIPTTTCTLSSYLLTTSDSITTYPDDIVVESSIFRPHTLNVPFISGLGGIQWEGYSFTLRDSMIYGWNGWPANVANVTQTYHNVSGITESNTPVITLDPGAAGISGKFAYEWGGFTGDYAAFNGHHGSTPTSNTTLTNISTGVYQTIVEAGSDPKTVQLVFVSPVNFATGNTITYTTTKSGLSCLNNNTYTITRINSFRATISASGCSAGYYDNTDGVAMTASLSTVGMTGGLGWVRMTEKGNIYGLLTVGGPGPITLENNYVNAQFANLFFGGGSNGAAANAAKTTTITSVDGTGIFTLGHVNGMAVGDYVTVFNSSAQPCQGKVDSISGTQITVSGVGTFRPTSGCSFSAGGSVRWRGFSISGVLLKRNTFELDVNTQHAGQKGYIEVKTMDGGYVVGNKFLGPTDVTSMFFTVRNDNGQGGWVTAQNMRLESNIDSSGSRAWDMLETQNGIATQWTIGDKFPNNQYWNNLAPESLNTPFSSVARGALDVRHNTWIPAATSKRGGYVSSGPTRIIQTTNCGNAPSGVRPLDWYDNIVGYGAYGFVALGNGGVGCWDLTKAGNVFVNNFAQSISEPGNQVATNVAALTLAGTCDSQGDNWQNCYLGGGSTYLGDGSDGKDPGVDMQLLTMDQNGWGEQAGLIRYDAYTKRTLNPAAWKIGSTRAVITANKINGGTCSFILYTNAARTTAHGDTDSAPEQDCSRTGNASTAGTVTLVLGTNTALTASTTYYYKLTMGSAVMVGEFSTVAAGSGIAASWNRARECGSDGSTFGTAVSANTPYSVAAGNVRYCRDAVGEPVEVLVAP